jgi:hypothetical protein
MVSNTRLTWDEVCRRAGGRRRYNKMRQVRAFKRLMMVKSLCLGYGTGYGSQARIARELGVHRSTICRDFQLLAAVEPYDPISILDEEAQTEEAWDREPEPRALQEPARPTHSTWELPDAQTAPVPPTPPTAIQVPRWLPASDQRHRTSPHKPQRRVMPFIPTEQLTSTGDTLTNPLRKTRP